MRKHVLLHVAAMTAALMLTAGCDEADKPTKVSPGSSTAPSGTPSPAASATPNGIDKLPAGSILTRTRSALLNATSVRIRGNIKDGGDIAFNIRYSGKRAATGDLDPGNQKMTVTRIGTTVYAKVSDAALRKLGGQSAVTLMSGKYFKSSAKDQRLKDFQALLDFMSLSKLAPELLTPSGTVSKGQHRSIKGRPTIGLDDSSGGTLYVATQGNPYPVLLDGGTAGRIEFSEYDAPFIVQPPPARSVVDLAELN